MMFRMFDWIRLTTHRDERGLLKIHEFFFLCDGHFSPISRLRDGGLRHTYAGRDWTRGQQWVARLRRSWPTRGGTVWESGERREAGVP